jgi:hypothetical protein
MDGLTEGVGSLGDAIGLEPHAKSASDIPVDKTSASTPPPFLVPIPLTPPPTCRRRVVRSGTTLGLPAHSIKRYGQERRPLKWEGRPQSEGQARQQEPSSSFPVGGNEIRRGESAPSHRCGDCSTAGAVVNRGGGFRNNDLWGHQRVRFRTPLPNPNPNPGSPRGQPRRTPPRAQLPTTPREIEGQTV